MSVSTRPAATVLTVIPRGASSFARKAGAIAAATASRSIQPVSARIVMLAPAFSTSNPSAGGPSQPAR
jgi:hypothetical protein